MFDAMLMLVLVAGVAQSSAHAGIVGEGPKPSPMPIAWEFDFRFVDLRRIVVQTAPRGEPQAYWYLLYTVTNTSAQTQRFYPQFEIVTEDLRIVPANVGISPIVFDAIRERHRITHPYLVHPTEAIGDLKTGRDNARDSVAIWREADVAANNFTVYVAGLSGETRLVPNPAYDPERPEEVTVAGPDGRTQRIVVNPRMFTLRKTLAIHYALPGSPAARRVVEPTRVGLEWIMR